jgi:hypothetical protein
MHSIYFRFRRNKGSGRTVRAAGLPPPAIVNAQSATPHFARRIYQAVFGSVKVRSIMPARVVSRWRILERHTGRYGVRRSRHRQNRQAGQASSVINPSTPSRQRSHSQNSVLAPLRARTGTGLF